MWAGGPPRRILYSPRYSRASFALPQRFGARALIALSTFSPPSFLVPLEVSCWPTTLVSFVSGDFFCTSLSDIASLCNMPDNCRELANVTNFAFKGFADLTDWDQRILALSDKISNPVGKVSLFQIVKGMFVNATPKLFCAPPDDLNSPFPILHFDHCRTAIHGENRC